MPEEGVRLCNLMIHMDHQNAVEAVFGQARVFGRAQLDADIVPFLPRDAPRQCLYHFGQYVFGQDPAGGADPLGQAHRIIAFASADVGDGHARADAGPVHDILRLVDAIARFLAGPAGRHDRCYRPIGARKIAGGDRALGGIAAAQLVAGGQQDERARQCRPDHQSTSSTSTFSPVTFWLSAAAMKGSSAPSRTSSGDVEVTPVRRSFTS